MAGSEYTVRLEAFEGPLDLLLFLIRRAEVEITDIPIAEITEQYLNYLKEIAEPPAGIASGPRTRRLDIEQAGEFLVMAATLMEIKSRMLSPRPAPAEGESDSARDQGDSAPDPRAELVRQLLEYKKFRDATDRLEDHRRDWDHRFPAARIPLAKPHQPEATEPGSQSDEPVDIEDLQIIDLLQAFARVVETVDFNRVGEHRVQIDDTPLEVHGDCIVELLRDSESAPGTRGGVRFESLFINRTRPEMIGVFLALLELVRQQRIRIDQESEQGELMLRLAPESSQSAAAPAVIVSTGSPAEPAPAS